jgi:hypothetical protein
MAHRWILCAVLLAPAQEPPHRARLERAAGAAFDLKGPYRESLDAATKNWLLTLPEKHPALLDLMAERDKKPYRELVPASGALPGVYLAAATQVLRVTGNPDLRAALAKFVERMLKLQDRDGYLGPFPKEARFTGRAPNSAEAWDPWGHHHAILGLLLWHEETGDAKALDAAKKAGDLLCSKFLRSGRKLAAFPNPEVNHAPVQALGLLHRRTASSKYGDLARQIVQEFAEKGGPDYVRLALAGKELHEAPKPRWEALASLAGLAEVYRATGKEDLRKAFEHHWWSAVKHERRNSGAFAFSVDPPGSPYRRGPVEPCATAAWIAAGVEMLRLTGESVVADEIELSTLNAAAAALPRAAPGAMTGVPSDGRRARSEELTCCTAGAARGLASVADWALLRDARGLVLNWYGPGTMTASVGGTKVALRQETDYPGDGKVVLEVAPEKPAKFALRLRVPHWSASTSLAVNGTAVEARRGTYAEVEREWAAGDRVELALDLSPHFWAGEREAAGKASIYRGPLLMAYEDRSVPVPRFGPQWKKSDDLWVAGVAGATFEADFEAEGIAWLGKRTEDGGMARILIDGREVARVDQFAPGRGGAFEWEVRGLSAGRHTIKVQVLDEKNPASKGRSVNVRSLTTPGEGPPELDAEGLTFAPARGEGAVLVLDTGTGVRLRDFATAGEDGGEVRTWLRVANLRHALFSRENPLRSSRSTGK